MTQRRPAPLRAAGPTAVAVLLAGVALALHPHLTGHPGPRAELRQIATLAARDRLVHGTLLLLLLALLAGFANYTVRRGLGRPAVVTGFVSFAAGIAALSVAGLIDGFILPELAVRSLDATAARQDAVAAMLAACGVAVNVATGGGIVATAIAIGAWSLDLVTGRGADRIAGVAGFVATALTIAVLIADGASMEPHALLAAIGPQALWYVALAASNGRGTEIETNHNA